MPSIRAIDLYFAYGGGEAVLGDLSFHLTDGWTGLVGANGCGKTTLLRLIAGDLEPDAGHLQRIPGRPTIARCPQRVGDADRYETFATCWSKSAMRWMSFLELEPEDYWDWDTLSPGTQKRWQIAAALHNTPAVALLDEPTNHLDRAGKAVLLRAMEAFDGLGIIVSHDRDFLDGVCDRVLWLDERGATVTPGGYSDARAHRQGWIRRQNAAIEALQAERDQLEAQLARKRAAAARASRAISSRSRMTSVRDSDARSMSAKGRAMRAAASLSADAGAASSQLAQIRDALGDKTYRDEVGSALKVDHAAASGTTALKMTREQIVRGDSLILREVDVHLAKGQRIWIDAPNGAGKTTLVEELLESMGDERVHYLPQSITTGDGDDLLGELHSLPREQLGAWMNMVAALGADPDEMLRSHRLSPGMARKLLLARGLSTPCSLMVLDEPTNHLDVLSIERLEAALEDFRGALLLITHDTAFARAATDERWTIRDGCVEIDAKRGP